MSIWSGPKMRVLYSGFAASSAIVEPFLRRRFKRRLLALDEGDDDVAVLGRVAAAHDHRVAVVDAGLDHRVALHLEREVLAVGEDVGRAGDVVGVVLDGGDRHAGRDAPHDRDRHRARVDDVGGRKAEIAAPRLRALDDAWLEAAAALALAVAPFGQLQDLDGARPVRQAADEAALDEGGDQAVDARLRLEVEGVLHLVEGGRHAVRLHARVDEEQELFLLLGQHVGVAPPSAVLSAGPRPGPEPLHKQSVNVHYPFSPRSARGGVLRAERTEFTRFARARRA